MYRTRVCVIYRFAIELIESNQERVKAAIILKEKLDYNDQMIYHLILTATVSIKPSNHVECINYSIFNINKIDFIFSSFFFCCVVWQNAIYETESFQWLCAHKIWYADRFFYLMPSTAVQNK